MEGWRMTEPETPDATPAEPTEGRYFWAWERCGNGEPELWERSHDGDWRSIDEVSKYDGLTWESWAFLSKYYSRIVPATPPKSDEGVRVWVHPQDLDLILGGHKDWNWDFDTEKDDGLTRTACRLTKETP